MDAPALHYRHSHFHRHFGALSRRASAVVQHSERSMPIPNRSLEERGPEPVLLQPRASKTHCSSSQGSDTCEKPVDTSNNLPIILGVVIPVVVCIVVCIILHRKFLARQRREDNDAHKSLDFGTEIGRKLSRKGKAKKGQQKIPEMQVSDFEKTIRQGRGMSMDMDMTSPYILPAALKGSRESLHSLSRSMKDDYDPYRPVTMVSNDNASTRFPRVRGGDTSSTLTGSTHITDSYGAGLLKNVKSISSSAPSRGESMTSPLSGSQSPSFSKNDSAFLKEAELPPPPPPPEPPMNMYDKETATSSTNLLAPSSDSERDSYFENNAQTFLTSDTYVPPPRSTSNPARQPYSSPNESRVTSTAQPTLPQIDIQEPDALESYNAYSNWEQQGQPQHESVYSHQDQPQHDSIYSQQHHRQNDSVYSRPAHESQPPTVQEQEPTPQGLAVQQPDYSQHRLSVSVRPLPPDDPNEDAETRAIRIRSFYREYFDVTRNPHHQAGEAPSYPLQNYYEDYGQEYLGDGAIFDPESGQFIVSAKPFADPVTRRAMTPPPRAPPRFQGASRHNSGGSTYSTGTFAPPPRGHSAMSNRGNRGFPAKPKRALPPPSPLKSLPTPHMLKDDSNLIFGATDFAPPVSFRDRQAGRRPDSPLGMSRPYSPSVKAFNPLTSSFDDLSVMPSPHMLRKSTTFTALDFAPPTKLRDIDSGSDAASIRSGRSGLSQVQVYNMRAGAYRLSRIPKELAGSKDEISVSLKPSWDMRT